MSVRAKALLRNFQGYSFALTAKIAKWNEPLHELFYLVMQKGLDFEGRLGDPK